MLNQYTKPYVESIRKCKTDKEISDILDKVYSDGFEDGANEGKDSDSARDGLAAEREFIESGMD